MGERWRLGKAVSPPSEDEYVVMCLNLYLSMSNCSFCLNVTFLNPRSCLALRATGRKRDEKDIERETGGLYRD